MSHELRTPMTGVLGMLDALRDEPLSGEQRETLEQAEVSARTLLDLINAIIDLSRAESRELQLESAPFDLRALVEARLDAIRPAASARRISVDVRFSTDAPEWVIGDESRVGQVLGVLLDNAVAYTEAGAISVAVEARTGIGAAPAVRASARDRRSGSAQPDEAATTGVRLRVLDTGRGIAPERQSSIFDPFARGQAASPGGGGLGLAIGRRLARRMGGDLSVESTVGVGSSFALDLPLQRPRRRGRACRR
jgi:signal transduction histidine kinase